MDELLETLDDDARLAVEVALGTAAAFGDVECGTAYLLFGAISTARGDVAQLAELFALDTIRIERAILAVRERFLLSGAAYDGDPALSHRARRAMTTERRDGKGRTGVFEILHGSLLDPASGANAVLRQLGIRPEEFARLVGYGTWHLTKQEADALLDALDRRGERRFPWWGPADGDDGLELLTAAAEVGRSRSAVATITSLQAFDDGIRFRLTIDSLNDWVLPPTLTPEEVLVPGLPAKLSIGPEMVKVAVQLADGRRTSNEVLEPRFTEARPVGARLICLGHRSEITRANDRRAAECRTECIDWWIWPVPPAGLFDIRIDWPAEVLHGSISFDGADLRTRLADAT